MPDALLDRALQYAADHQGAFLAGLIDLLRIPSISTDSAYKSDVRRAGEFVADELRRLDFARVALHETPGHPIVYGEHLAAGPSRPTVLVYGHYDVQPADPLELWHSPPFEPSVRDGNLYARGATDNKGQHYSHLKGLESWLRGAGTLPLNVKVVIEGEEEVGSPNLTPWVAANREMLRCDAVLVSDTGMVGPGQPAIVTSLRGLVYFDIHVVGPNADMHSGTGNTLGNPLNELTTLLAKLRGPDEAGRIAIPGFYDAVLEPDAKQRADAQALDDDAAYLTQHGAPAVTGEPGYSTNERMWYRPSFDVNGLIGGYTGEGAKTVIPSWAHAKFSCRLVPNQDPAAVAAAIEARVRELAPPSVRVEVVKDKEARPVRVPTDSPAMQAAARALAATFGREPAFIGGGGSIPVVADFAEQLAVPVILAGFSLPDDALHSPNEKYSLEHSYYPGIRASIRLLDELSRIND